MGRPQGLKAALVGLVVLFLCLVSRAQSLTDCAIAANAFPSLNINASTATSCCNNSTIYCSGSSVTQISFFSAGLNGSISPLLGKLTSLTNLDLHSNLLTGSIPQELGNLTKLQTLSLYSNQLTGPIPPQLGNLTSLTKLWLYSNQLNGSIPLELGNLRSLQNLYLYSNQLTGSIPPQLGNLTYLIDLNLKFNQLTGSIPWQLSNLTKLTNLDLSSNQLTGSIPPQLGNMTWLFYLYLNNNQLTGSIPPQLGNMRTLQQLCLYSNPLTGSIPPQLGNLTSLLSLYLYSTKLTGSIPAELGNLANLNNLYLFNNQLTGSIPPQLGNLTQLLYLSLSGNQLTGSIPPQLGNLTKVHYLWLFSNQLTGSIPPQLGNLTSLTWLDLTNCSLNGSVPAELGNILNNVGLREIYLSLLGDGNTFTPPAPAWAANATAQLGSNFQLAFNSPSPAPSSSPSVITSASPTAILPSPSSTPSLASSPSTTPSMSSTPSTTPSTLPSSSPSPPVCVPSSSSCPKASPLFTPFDSSVLHHHGKSVIAQDMLFIIGGDKMESWPFGDTFLTQIDLRTGTVNAITLFKGSVGEYVLTSVQETSAGVQALLCGGWDGSTSILNACNNVQLLGGTYQQLQSSTFAGYALSAAGSWNNRTFILGGKRFGVFNFQMQSYMTVLSANMNIQTTLDVSIQKSASFPYFDSAYAQLSNLLVLFGGNNNTNVGNLLSIVDMNTGLLFNIPIATSGLWPASRSGAALAGVRIDVVNAAANISNFVFLLHGGSNDQNVFSDMWLLTVTNATTNSSSSPIPYSAQWTSIVVGVSPPLYGHSASVFQNNYVFLSAGLVSLVPTKIGSSGVYVYSVKDGQWISDLSVIQQQLA